MRKKLRENVSYLSYKNINFHFYTKIAPTYQKENNILKNLFDAKKIVAKIVFQNK